MQKSGMVQLINWEERIDTQVQIYGINKHSCYPNTGDVETGKSLGAIAFQLK